MLMKRQRKQLLLSILIALLILFPTQLMAETDTGFQRIEQPLSVKIFVTVSGMGLIGLELWWFLLSNNQTNNKSPRE